MVKQFCDSNGMPWIMRMNKMLIRSYIRPPVVNKISPLGEQAAKEINEEIRKMKERSEKEMSNEEIRNEINGATKKLRETTRMVNEALNHAAGRLDKAEKEAYDRGLNDCWEMVWNVFEYVPAIRAEIFGVSPANFGQILTNFTPQQALEKIRAWEEKKAEEERKKQEEAEKIQIGDVVEIHIRRETAIGDRVDVWTGVVIDNNEYRLYYFDHLGKMDMVQYTENVRVKKTGKHVDILGALK